MNFLRGFAGLEADFTGIRYHMHFSYDFMISSYLMMTSNDRQPTTASGRWNGRVLQQELVDWPD